MSRIFSEDHKRKISEALTGKKASLEARMNMSLSHKGYKYPEGRLGNNKGKPRKDITGMRFGRWIAIRPAGSQQKGGGVIWLCKCDCGKEVCVSGRNLRSGTSQSCGCVAKEILSEVGKANRKHGHAGLKRSSEYFTWESMTQRCLNEKHKSFKYYGARDISICERWQGEHGFENFLKDMGPRPKGLTLDRIENDGNYEPGNCRWADWETQASNRRISI